MTTTSQSIRAATLSAANQALSDAVNALLPIAQDEYGEKRKGPALKACASIERAQRMLIEDKRP